MNFTPADILGAQRILCQRSLVDFVRFAWPILEPEMPYVHNWHIECICAHLEAVTRGEINRLLINVPPGTSKSLLTSVMWPAWEWGPQDKRTYRYLNTSFNEGPVTRDTRKMRDLVASSWYRTLWPKVRLTRTGETSFANSSTGSREGVPFGSLTSQRGDRLIIDDPHSTETAESDADRLKTTRRFREGAINRLNDQAKSAIVVIMQRLHTEDLSGVIEKLGLDYTHVMLPMEFEPARALQSNIYSDPRTVEGELLDPVRFPPNVIEDLKLGMTSYGYAGQYQQRPTAREGGLFKHHWFADKIVKQVPSGGRYCRAWDFAGTVKKSKGKPDWTVGLRMVRVGTKYYIDHIRRLQDTPGIVEANVKGCAATDPRGTVIRIPQDPGQAGVAQRDAYLASLAGYNVKAMSVTGDKETRAQPAAIQAQAGNIYLVEGQWNAAFLDEICTFPMGSHDDQVDALSDAFNELALGGGYDLLAAL